MDHSAFGKSILADSPDWLKFKNPASPAVRREAEEKVRQ